MAANKKAAKEGGGLKHAFGDKWFLPIVLDLERFEDLCTPIFPEMDAITKEDAPSWAFRSIWNGASLDLEYSGLALPSEMDARRIGMLVGAKWSLCDAYVPAGRSEAEKGEAFQAWGCFKSSAIVANCSRAASRSAVMSAAMISGAGRLALSSSASSFSQKMSRFTLSRLVSSS